MATTPDEKIEEEIDDEAMAAEWAAMTDAEGAADPVGDIFAEAGGDDDGTSSAVDIIRTRRSKMISSIGKRS